MRAAERGCGSDAGCGADGVLARASALPAAEGPTPTLGGVDAGPRGWLRGAGGRWRRCGRRRSRCRSPIRATTALIATSCLPEPALRSARQRPATGISVSTLSVEISNSGSSRSTLSPGFFSQRVSVPSTILSPIWGITTSVIGSPAILLLPSPIRNRKRSRTRRQWRASPLRGSPGSPSCAASKPVSSSRTEQCI